MKCFLFIAIWTTLTIFLSTGDEISGKCPEKDPKGKIIRLPHETECTLYYSCQKGKKYLAFCPYMDKKEIKRYQFNPITQFCDWPEFAGCISKENSTIILNINYANEETTITKKSTTTTTEPKTTTTESTTTTTEPTITTTEPKTTTIEATTRKIISFPTTVPLLSTTAKLQKTEAHITSGDRIIKNYMCTYENCNEVENLEVDGKVDGDTTNIFLMPLFWIAILSLLVMSLVTITICRIRCGRGNKKTYQVNKNEVKLERV